MGKEMHIMLNDHEGHTMDLLSSSVDFLVDG
jgi:hypothetical protein